jgi:hypothetical protein
MWHSQFMIKSLAVILSAWMVGCSTPNGNFSMKKSAVDGNLSIWGPDERPEDAAADWMVEKAKMFHYNNQYASRYPLFKFCQSRHGHAGYEAMFARREGSRLNITYYFDGQGRFLTFTRLLCEGF